MTRGELIRDVRNALEARLTETDIADVVDAVFARIERALQEEGRYVHTGFGTFKTSVREARDGLNPQTGERIHIPESVSVRFKAADSLKRRL